MTEKIIDTFTSCSALSGSLKTPRPDTYKLYNIIGSGVTETP